MKKQILLFVSLYLSIVPISSRTIKLPDDIVIRRTEYGVPHIKATSLYGVTLGLAYCEVEDYGESVIQALVAARGDVALVEGYDAIDSDFIRQQSYQRAMETYFLLDQDTRDMNEGFAAGINVYLQTFPNEFPEYTSFTLINSLSLFCQKKKQDKKG
jgi:acyl-homoserine-lactone acylase